MTPLGRGILDRANCVAHAPFIGEDYRANDRGVNFLIEADEWIAAEIAAQYCNLDHLPEEEKDKRRAELCDRADELFKKAVAGGVQGRVSVIGKLIFVADAVFHGRGGDDGVQAAAALALCSVEDCPRHDAEQTDQSIAVEIAAAEVWPNTLTEAEANKVREGAKRSGAGDRLHEFQMLLREAKQERSGTSQEDQDGELTAEEIAETEADMAVAAETTFEAVVIEGKEPSPQDWANIGTTLWAAYRLLPYNDKELAAKIAADDLEDAFSDLVSVIPGCVERLEAGIEIAKAVQARLHIVLARDYLSSKGGDLVDEKVAETEAKTATVSVEPKWYEQPPMVAVTEAQCICGEAKRLLTIATGEHFCSDGLEDNLVQVAQRLVETLDKQLDKVVSAIAQEAKAEGKAA